MSARLNLFGSPVFATVAGHTPIPATRQMQLLAYLAARRSWQRRDDVAALFWPDRSNKEARSNLRNLIHKTQAHAQFAPMELTDHAMRVSVASDVIDFEAAFDASDWGSAARLGSSDLLQGFESEVTEPYLDWLAKEREAILTNWKKAVQALLDVTSTPAAQRLALAMTWANRCPYDEDAVRAQVAIELEMQHQSAATRIYRAFEQRLKHEFGVTPSQQFRQIALADAATTSSTNAHGQAAVQRVLTQLRKPSEPAPQPIFGRKIELQRLKSLLADSAVRLVTLSGPGGVGKSTLLKALFTQLFEADQTEAHLVDASALQSAQAIILAIASALGVEVRDPASAEAALVSHLRRQACVLLIDGAEQSDVAHHVAHLLNKCPQVQLVIATRQHLNIAGEHLLVLDGFLLPDADETDPEVLATNDAVRFVIDAMRRAGQTVDLAHDATTIAALVRQVEGLPLAISLLANLTRMFPLKTLLDNLREGVAGKAQAGWLGIGGLMPALTASFERSWNALSAAEQSALARLAVFPETFDGAAACAVAATELPVIVSLTDKSLVRAAANGRLSLHAAIRACVLAVSPISNDAQTAFMEYYQRGLSARFDLMGRNSWQPIKQYLRDEWINIETAWRHALDQRVYAVLLSLADVLLWQTDSIDPNRDSGRLFLEAERQLRANVHAPLALKASLLAGLARSSANQSNAVSAVNYARSALHEAVRAKHRYALYSAMDVLGNAYLMLGKLEDAEAILVRAAKMSTGADEDHFRLLFCNHRAILSCLKGDLDTALSLLDQVASNHQRLDRITEAVRAILNQAWCCGFCGDSARALKYLDEAARLAKSAGLDRAFEVCALSDASEIHFQRGDLTQARVCIAKANAIASYGRLTVAPARLLLFRNAQIELSEHDAAAAAPRILEILQAIADSIAGADLIWSAFFLAAKWFHCVGDNAACRALLGHVSVQTHNKKNREAAFRMLGVLGEETDVPIGAMEVQSASAPVDIAQAVIDRINTMRTWPT